MKFLIIVAFLFLSATAEKSRFDNYRVYNVMVENQKQFEAMQYLAEHSDAYNFWDDPKIGDSFEIVVPPHMFSHFGEISDTLRLKTKVIIENLQNQIDIEARPSRMFVPYNSITWDAYYPVDQIYSWLDTLPAAHTGVSVSNIGTTVGGRPIKLVSIARKPTNRAIIIEANIHAREWVSHATATWIINQLLTSNDADTRDFAENINWYIIPVVNPDGYEFSRTNNRNWRKTRESVSSLCFGVDGNRNFAYNWLVPDEGGNLGASTSPCSDTYAGASPFQSAESTAVNKVLNDYHNRTDVFLSFHSYGHWMLHAWGTSRADGPRKAIHTRVGGAFATGLAQRDGINYRVGSTIELLYAASGSSPDHAIGHYNIPIAFTLEMRGNGAYGNYGFVLPPNLIIPNSLEVWDGLVALIKQSRTEGYF